jgi:hypothetical protein
MFPYPNLNGIPYLAEDREAAGGAQCCESSNIAIGSALQQIGVVLCDPIFDGVVVPLCSVCYAEFDLLAP